MKLQISRIFSVFFFSSFLHLKLSLVSTDRLYLDFWVLAFNPSPAPRTTDLFGVLVIPNNPKVLFPHPERAGFAQCLQRGLVLRFEGYTRSSAGVARF